MNDNTIYKEAFKQFLIFCFCVAATRFSQGIFIGLMTLFGIYWAFQGKVGKAFGLYLMIAFMIVLNPNILPKDGMFFGILARFGPLLIGMTLMSKGLLSKNRYRLPFGGLVVFLAVAAISSAWGWAPFVSYLKLINFTVFLFGIWIGAQGFQGNLNEIMTLRAVLLALATFLILGSAVLIPFPGISTLNALRQFNEVDNVQLLNEIMREHIESGGMTLFCGVTFQSQTLAPLLSCAYAWVVCDMLFIEEKFRWPHALLLIVGLPLLYKTRSRVAFLCLITIAILVYFYLPRKILLNWRVKKWLGALLGVVAVLSVIVIIFAEVHNNAISRWMRKTDDVKGDTRSLQEAFTDSRQGLIEMCMADFRQSPWLGMGFQVAFYTKDQVAGSRGLVLSSPIEKGLLPVMVLGETGVIGLFVFTVFLGVFYCSCSRRQLFITIALFAVLLTTNLGEACFFSPGGPGGIEWLFCVMGGYGSDMWLITTNRRRIDGLMIG